MIYILAAGTSERWKEFKPEGQPDDKLMADIYGKPLLQRTADILKMKKKHFIYVRRFYKELGLRDEIVVGETKCVTDTIYQTRSYWKGVCTFLCGDVVWSERAINTILNHKSPTYTMFGNSHEIFALKFGPSFYQGMIDHIELLQSLNCAGRLTDLRWVLNTGDVRRDELRSEYKSRQIDQDFIFLPGWTTDIDHAKAYSRFLKSIRARLELKRRDAYEKLLDQSSSGIKS